jgi:hypothetical protein
MWNGKTNKMVAIYEVEEKIQIERKTPQKMICTFHSMSWNHSWFQLLVWQMVVLPMKSTRGNYLPNFAC